MSAADLALFRVVLENPIMTICIVLPILAVVILAIVISQSSNTTQQTSTTGSPQPTSGVVADVDETNHGQHTKESNQQPTPLFQGFPSLTMDVFGSGSDNQLVYRDLKGKKLIELRQHLETDLLILDSCKLYTNGFSIRTRSLSLKNAVLVLGTRKDTSHSTSYERSRLEPCRFQSVPDEVKETILEASLKLNKQERFDKTPKEKNAMDLLAAHTICMDGISCIQKHDNRDFVLVTKTDANRLTTLHVYGLGNVYMVD